MGIFLFAVFAFHKEPGGLHNEKYCGDEHREANQVAAESLLENIQRVTGSGVAEEEEVGFATDDQVGHQSNGSKTGQNQQAPGQRLHTGLDVAAGGQGHGVHNK